jgi:hypothetical protein
MTQEYTLGRFKSSTVTTNAMNVDYIQVSLTCIQFVSSYFSSVSSKIASSL